ncbi:MAG: DUF4962 domain-containing protein, partial [Opitutae bacterium]|nr:DUF4962 domain-containing protein [Opitutae bacterium]
MNSRAAWVIWLSLGCAGWGGTTPFAVDTAPVPAKHAPLAPADGAIAATNPPPLIWRHDATAAHYTVELSPTPDFSREVIRVGQVPAPFYNHDAALAPGLWHWRYFVVRADGAISLPGPVRSFRVTGDSLALPIPAGAALLAALPGHPRIFTRPETLAEFRARRLGAGRDAWDNIRTKADALLALAPARPPLDPLPPTPASHRQQIFHVTPAATTIPRDYRVADLRRDADRADLLSLAWLISGDERYARAARDWALAVAPFRIDHHLTTIAQRGQHDTVVYAYEEGLAAIACTYDRLAGLLSAGDRRALLDHVEYHGEAALHWIRNVMKIHLEYHDSNAQQCMHALLTTALAVAGDSAQANAWLLYLVPQYASRIAWMGDDGGCSEGQYYAYKLHYLLKALAALRTATGIDLFRQPALRHAGDFWLYCMSLNYWWPHHGDTMPLVNPHGNVADASIAALLASATGARPVQWWSESVPADPNHIPFSYLSATGLRPQPPVAVAQARAFRATGQLAAFARFYDHAAPRIFFRSSLWGGYGHAHADQNSFVLHAGGEILAADVGYHSFFGDDNYNHVCTQTLAHNSVLVDGRGQSNDIEGKGALTAFFNSPDCVFFSGDASQAYGPALNRFRRDVLYLRPDVFIVADELRAPTPSEWSWVLNSFSAPVIDAPAREFLVAQRETRLWGKQVFPERLHYTSSSTRKLPLLTRRWSRYTEAFPEPWCLQATTGKTRATEFLSVLHSYNEPQGRRAQLAQSLQNATTSAVTLETSGGKETILLRRRQEKTGTLDAWGLNCDGRAFAGLRDKTGNFVRWTAIAARTASADGRALLRAAQPVDLALTVGTAAAAAQLWTQAPAPTTVTLALPARPAKILAFAPNQFAAGESVSFRWADGQLELAVPEGTRTFWIDPTVAPSALPARLT